MGNFILPLLIRRSAEMGCVMFSGRLLSPRGEDPHPKPPALGSCSLLGQNDLCRGKSLGRKTRGLGSGLGPAANPLRDLGQAPEDIP